MGGPKREGTFMEFLKNNLRAVVIAILAVGVVIAVSTNSDSSTEDNNKDQTSEVADNQSQDSSETASDSEGGTDTERKTVQTVEKTDGDYSISANLGDSQTTLVRKVIAQYSDEQDQTLSAEQKLYVETNIVRNDLETTDFINEDDVVKVSEETMKTRFEEAKNLSESKLARWAVYL
jgi:hypothetical protein